MKGSNTSSTKGLLVELPTQDERKNEALRDYMVAYTEWNRSRIDSEEANSRFVAAAREALNQGALPSELRDAIRLEETKAIRMTEFD